MSMGTWTERAKMGVVGALETNVNGLRAVARGAEMFTNAGTNAG